MTVVIVKLEHTDGTIRYIECDNFKVTGKLINSNRNFPAIYTTNYLHAMSINLWRGTVWGHDVITDKWRKLREVYN